MRTRTMAVSVAVLACGAMIALPRVMPGRLDIRAAGVSQDAARPGLDIEIRHSGWGSVFVTGYSRDNLIPVCEDPASITGYQHVDLLCGTGLTEVKFSRGDRAAARISAHWMKPDRRAGIVYFRHSNTGILSLLSRLGLWTIGPPQAHLAWVEDYQPLDGTRLTQLRGQ